MVEIRKPYEPVPKYVQAFEKPSMAQQAMKDECDINRIVTQYARTGQWSHVAAGAFFAELPDQVDFQDAMHLVMESQARFDQLPSNVRDAFRNDPAEFLSFMGQADSEQKRKRLVDLGLIRAPDPIPKAPKPTQSPQEPDEG